MRYDSVRQTVRASPILAGRIEGGSGNEPPPGESIARCPLKRCPIIDIVSAKRPAPYYPSGAPAARPCLRGGPRSLAVQEEIPPSRK